MLSEELFKLWFLFGCKYRANLIAALLALLFEPRIVLIVNDLHFRMPLFQDASSCFAWSLVKLSSRVSRATRRSCRRNSVTTAISPCRLSLFEGSMPPTEAELIFRALDTFRIELPSWGFANTGTRFGKFLQPAAASTNDEKLSDAGQVHSLTGACPTVALHVQWDFCDGLAGVSAAKKSAEKHGVRAGAINPNLFENQIYKHGSFGNPDRSVRDRALQHVKESIEIARQLGSRDISLWFADGSNYQGTGPTVRGGAHQLCERGRRHHFVCL